MMRGDAVVFEYHGMLNFYKLYIKKKYESSKIDGIALEINHLNYRIL